MGEVEVRQRPLGHHDHRPGTVERRPPGRRLPLRRARGLHVPDRHRTHEVDVVRKVGTVELVTGNAQQGGRVRQLHRALDQRREVVRGTQLGQQPVQHLLVRAHRRDEPRVRRDVGRLLILTGKDRHRPEVGRVDARIGQADHADRDPPFRASAGGAQPRRPRAEEQHVGDQILVRIGFEKSLQGPVLLGHRPGKAVVPVVVDVAGTGRRTTAHPPGAERGGVVIGIAGQPRKDQTRLSYVIPQRRPGEHGDLVPASGQRPADGQQRPQLARNRWRRDDDPRHATRVKARSADAWSREEGRWTRESALVEVEAWRRL